MARSPSDFLVICFCGLEGAQRSIAFLSFLILLRDESLENLWGGGGGANFKKTPPRENEMKKSSCTLSDPEKYSYAGLKKFIQAKR